MPKTPKLFKIMAEVPMSKPNLEIPKVFELPKTNKLRIMHSFFKTNRYSKLVLIL